MTDKFCDEHKVQCKDLREHTEEIKALEMELPRKVSYKVATIILTVFIPICGFFAYATLEHRGKIAATEATVKALCENTDKIVRNQDMIMQRLDTINARQLRVMQRLNLDPKWGE